MTARLVAITFDTATEEYLKDVMSQDEAGLMALAEMSQFGNLDGLRVRLKNLPDADYLLLVGGNMKGETTASFKLVNSDTNEVVHSTTLELQPLIQSAIENGEEFEELSRLSLDHESDAETQAAADEQSEKINIRRAAYLEGLLSPYLKGHQKFNLELLDTLDFLTYPSITGAVSGFDPHNTDAVQTVLPASGNKYTLH